VSLGEWARQQDIHPQTAYRWFRTGTLPVPARKMGKLILVGDLEAGRVSSRLTAVYARVSPADQRDDLDRQVARVCSWAAANGFSIDRAVTEVGPGLNGKRRKSPGLVSDPKVTTILVGHRDRFARFGSEYLAASLQASGLKTTGLRHGTRYHELRHYHASLLIRRGENVKTVQARLGHASAVETLNTYAHLWPDSEDRTRTAIDDVLGSATRAEAGRAVS